MLGDPKVAATAPPEPPAATEAKVHPEILTALELQAALPPPQEALFSSAAYTAPPLPALETSLKEELETLSTAVCAQALK